MLFFSSLLEGRASEERMSTPTTAPVFAKVPAGADFPGIERAILALWDRLDAFHESNRRRAGSKGEGEFVFYDGPPFATGTPHYGHLLAGTIKDIVPRFWNMRGHHVERRFGWDCHGLPIEALAQKALGIEGAAAIRQDVAGFNEQCRSMVQEYVAEWRRTVNRMGRWVDFDRDYKTMDRDFMESVWWVFKRLWDQGRIYKSHRIMPYSPKLATPLSKFEVKEENYREVQDPAVTVRFRIRSEKSPKAVSSLPGVAEGRAYMLAWTTTPWTLLSNVALCVGPEIRYAYIQDIVSGDYYVLAKERLAAYYHTPEKYSLITEVSGTDLCFLAYEPLFPFFAKGRTVFSVLTDGFVTTSDGTGVVHIAPAYGEDDYRVARSHGLFGYMRDHASSTVDAPSAGRTETVALNDFLDEECRFATVRDATVDAWFIAECQGRFCKDADKAIIKRLKDEGKLVHQSTLVHSYPFCDRTDFPLIYRAIDAWYVKVEDLRDKLVANNQQVRWVPDAIGSNRFGNWLKEARDWNVSRNRFWGSCLPIWVNVTDSSDQLCFGSVADLEDAAGRPRGSITDLHKHHLDAIEITKGGKTYRRTPEVLDCWFESGSMPYAQVHWMGGADGKQPPPVFPAQFIAEGLDQTRGWFYTLMVLSTALFDRPAFQNVVVNGIVLAEDGNKMSKSKKNYPDPNLILDEVGADPLRAYLINSPLVRAESLRFSEKGLREIVRTVVLPLWNALSFFTTYATADSYDPRRTPAPPVVQRHDLDRWILSVLQSLVRDVNREMEAYRLYNVVPRLLAFIDDLTNWYIRSSRARFWATAGKDGQSAAFATLYEVLTTFAQVLAPFMPFLTEEIHQRLVVVVDAAAPKSVHWCDYPQPVAALIDAGLEERMAVARRVVGLALKLRNDQKLKVRQPLARLTVISRDAGVRAAAEAAAALIADELNVKAVSTDADEQRFCAVSVKPNFQVLRARAGAKLKEIGAALTSWSHAEVAPLEAGGTVEVAGVALTLADLLLTRTTTAGGAIASDGTITVALDTALTPELLREGHAREFISVLQQARKAAGFDVSDRIVVVWHSADAELATALREYAAIVAAEVLALGFTEDPALTDATVAEINGKAVRVHLAKV